MTRSSFLRLLKIGGSILVISVVVIYATWRSLAYARGPHITISEPANWSSISAPTVLIKGTVERAHIVTLNGKDIAIDEAGNFNETLIVFPGTNIVTLVARDQFQRSIQEQLTLTGAQK